MAELGAIPSHITHKNFINLCFFLTHFAPLLVAMITYKYHSFQYCIKVYKPNEHQHTPRFLDVLNFI